MSISKQYTKEMKAELNYSATWLPTKIVTPGDVGTVTKYEFQHLTNISNLGISFEIIPSPVQAEFDYYSTNSVSITTKASGQPPLVGTDFSTTDAGISVKFSRNNAIALRMSQCSSIRIADLRDLRKQILLKYKSGDWTKEMVVVTEVVKAACATIIISKSANAQIDLLAHGKIGAPELNMANVDAKFQVLKSSNIAFNIIAERDLTPLFRFAGIRKSFIRRTEPELGLKRQPRQITGFCVLDYSDFDPLS